MRKLRYYFACLLLTANFNVAHAHTIIDTHKPTLISLTENLFHTLFGFHHPILLLVTIIFIVYLFISNKILFSYASYIRYRKNNTSRKDN